MATYSRSLLQNFDNWWFWIWKNSSLNLINEQDDIDKIYLYAKDFSEPRHEFFIKEREDAGTNNLNDSSVIIESLNTMGDIFENIDDYNQSRKIKKLIVFNEMIADIMTNKKFLAIIKILFIRCRKLNISLVFIPQSYFSVPKDVRLNSTHYLIMKISNKREWNPPGLCSWTLQHRLYSVSNLTCINIDSHRCPKQFSKIVLISQSIYSTSVSARSVDIYNWGIRSDLENSIIP